MKTIFTLTNLLISITFLNQFILVANSLCGLQPGCGCHTRYSIKRPTCSTEENVHWCSSDISCNLGQCSGTILIGSQPLCSMLPKNGILFFEEYELCSIPGMIKKQYAYLADSKGNTYNPLNPLVINSHVGQGTFKVSSDLSFKLSFEIAQNGNIFGFSDQTGFYSFIPSISMCGVPYWTATSSLGNGNGNALSTGSSTFVSACSCNQISSSAPPTDGPSLPPTWPSQSPTMITSQPSQSTPQPSLSTSQPSWPTSQPAITTPQPTNPTPPPTWPTSQPTWPTQSPAWPTPQPSWPTPQPSWPTPQPSWPTSQPTWPTQSPAWPTPQPTWPTSQPTNPTSQPTWPTSQPTWPTPQPSWPTPQPSWPTPRPSWPTPQPSWPTRSPTREPVCPSSAPLKCNGNYGEYCCPYGLGGSTSVCCNSINSCTCSATGYCPFKNQCCTSTNPVMCTGSNGKEYCCKYGSNGSTNVCCPATNNCAFEGACCPASAPLFCGTPGKRFCCPYGSGGSTNVCCSSSCSSNGYCRLQQSLIAYVDHFLGPTEPQPETEKTHNSPTLRVGDNSENKSTQIGLAAIIGTNGDGKGSNAEEIQVGKVNP